MNKYFTQHALQVLMQNENDDVKVVVARTFHRDTNSFFRSFFRPSKVTLTLHSDGTILSDRTDPLSGTDEGIDVNSVELKYSFSDDKGKSRYRWMVFASYISGIIFVVASLAIDSQTLFSEFTVDHGIALLCLLVWCIWDVVRDKVLIQETLTIKTATGKLLKIKGDLPNQDTHKITASMFLLAGWLAVYLTTPVGSWEEIAFLTVGTLIALVIFKDHMDWISADDDHVPSHTLSHFYFAILNVLNHDFGGVKPRSDVENIEFTKVKKKLDKYQPIFGDIVAAKDIFASKSPSLIVIAIGATTERLMKKACDSLGISRKPNARPTLQSFIQQYQTKKPLNEKSMTQLNLIKEFRNRAAHHFNIDWDESVIVLNQFCQFVEWYADSHAFEELE